MFQEDALRGGVEENVFVHFGDHGRGALDWELAGAAGLAAGLDGAGDALWQPRFADRLAKLHQAGIQRPGIARMLDDLPCDIPLTPDPSGAVHGRIVIKNPGQDPGDVAIDDGFGEAKGEAGNRPGGVRADAG